MRSGGRREDPRAIQALDVSQPSPCPLLREWATGLGNYPCLR